MRHQNFNVQFGDVWAIGPHRLLCGDSTEKTLMQKFLKNYHPKVCITDPPYGVSYNSKNKSNPLWKLKVKNDHIVNWGDALRNAKAPALYVWYSFNGLEVVSKGIRDSGYEAKQTVIWVKNHFSLQRYLYQIQHEQCLVCIKPGSMTKGFWTGDRKQTTIWNVPSVRSGQRLHSTQKPIGVYTIPIQNHTNEGDYALDLFAGSGTIFEACQLTKRIGLGVELCPQACNIILNRMMQLQLETCLELNLFDQQRSNHVVEKNLYSLQANSSIGVVS